MVLAFEEDRIDAPIIMGLIHEPLEDLIENASDSESQPESEVIHPDPAADRLPFEATIDEDRVVLNAEKEIVLRCGKSSITLRKDGRVLIRGADVVSRSSGPNRIKGASVQVN